MMRKLQMLSRRMEIVCLEASRCLGLRPRCYL